MKGIKFGRLTIEEETFCIELFDRCGEPVSGKIMDRLTIAKVVQKPWTCVILKNGKKEGVGFSKQCRYAPDKDEWNEDIGTKIALSRAVRNLLEK